MKRSIPLLAAVLLLLAVAPAAMADHCVRCKISMDFSCLWNTNFGRTDCFSDGFSCTLNGPLCNHQLAATPFAAEFTVASVERLDEPRTPAATAIAELTPSETPQPQTR